MFKAKRQIVFPISAGEYDHNTNTDFGGDTLTDAEISGTGTGAVVRIKLNPRNTGYKTSTAENGSVGSGDSNYDWRVGSRRSPLSEVRSNDGTTVLANTHTYEVTSILQCTDFNFAIPSNAVILGIVVRWKKRQTGTIDVHDQYVRLTYGGSYVGDNNATTTKWPNTLTTTIYGGSTDLWGYSWTPAKINSSTFGVGLSAHNNSGYNPDLHTDYVDLLVYFATASGTFVSSSIGGTYPIMDWDTITLGHTIPANTTLTYSILRASDNAVLKSNVSSGDSLSGIGSVPIKVKATLTTSNGTSNPSIDRVQVTSKRMLIKGF